MSSPIKNPPLKPPRIRKTVSVPYDVTPEPSPQDRHHVAKVNLISALKRADARERSSANSDNCSKSHDTLNEIGSTNVESHDEPTTVDNDVQPSKSPNLPHNDTVPTIIGVPAKPSPPLSSTKPTSVSTLSQESCDDDDDDAFDLQSSDATSKSSPQENNKRPLLPPNKSRATTFPSKLSPSPKQKRTHRSESTDDSPSRRPMPPPIPRTKSHGEHVIGSDVVAKQPVVPQSSPQTKSHDEHVIGSDVVAKQPIIPPPQAKSHDKHVIAPEDVRQLPVDITKPEGNSFDQEEVNDGMNNVETNTIPVSPTSTSSGGITENTVMYSTSPTLSDRQDNNVTSDSDISNTRVSPSNETANDCTDGGIPSRPVTTTHKKQTHKKPTVMRKNDSSWIKQKNQDDTTSVPNPTPLVTTPSVAPSTTPPKKIAPYRSITILPDKKPVFSSSSLLNDTSKPVVGPSGQYYPPAVRTKTPEPRDLTRVDNLVLRKTHSNDRVLVVNKGEKEEEERGKASEMSGKKPRRFMKTRRSSSFNGENKLRPVSMMDSVQSSKKDKDSFTASSTLSRSMIESAKEGQQDKKSKSGSKVKDFFFGRGKMSSIADDIQEGSSSDDEVGGTISRMPKKSFERKPPPWETQVSDSPVDDYVPEYNQLFEYVYVFGLKEDRAKRLSSEVLYRYPPASREFAKDDALRSIDQFCFPDIEQWKPVLSYQSENYSFVLTSMDGSRRFGYCRRLLPDGKEARLPEVYCIISPLGCFNLYSTLLDHIEQRRSISKAAVYSFLSSIVANPFPGPGRSVSIKVLPARDRAMEYIELKRPHDSRLEHVDFAELYNTLGPKMLIQVFSSLLMERRVILAAHRLSKLSSCCHALLALLYPFEWQHTFIPVLPNSLIDFCGSPLPFIIGISPTMAKKLDKLDIQMEEALVVDLDKKKFIKRFEDESSILPNKVFQFLMNKLQAAVISNEYSKPPGHRSGQAKADQTIVQAFMTVSAYFFGGLKTYLQVVDPSTGERKLQKSDFKRSFHSKSTRRFLEAFLETQMFDKYIEERENPVKSATISQGLFEKKLPELMEKMPEIELFSNKKKFWKKRKGTINI